MTPTAAKRQAQSDDILTRFFGLDERERRLVLRGLTKAQTAEYTTRWFGFQNDGQRDPPDDWRIWLIQAGRGFGKTRAGAEWVSEVARGMPGAVVASDRARGGGAAAWREPGNPAGRRFRAVAAAHYSPRLKG